ncbi:hypothetical protein HSX11_16575 [Oxalobacteraceae bacterium]|nr:hypothetical protein [Oxalobacteraceae bacterium]
MQLLIGPGLPLALLALSLPAQAIDRALFMVARRPSGAMWVGQGSC